MLYLHLDKQLVAKVTWSQACCPKGRSVLLTSQLPCTENFSPGIWSQLSNSCKIDDGQNLPPLWQQTCLPHFA